MKPKRRWKRGNNYKSNDYLTNAVNKYGWDSFQKVIIASGITEEEAKNFEILLIDKLDTMNSDKGYNLTAGGDGVVGYKHTDTTKEKLRRAKLGKNNPMYGVSMKGSESGMYGKPSPRRKKVRCITTDEIFNSVTAGARKYGLGKSNLSRTCKGIHEYCGRLNGELLRWEYAD